MDVSVQRPPLWLFKAAILLFSLQSEQWESRDRKGHSPLQNIMCVGVGHDSLVHNQTGATTKLSSGLCFKKMPFGGDKQIAFELPYLWSPAGRNLFWKEEPVAHSEYATPLASGSPNSPFSVMTQGAQKWWWRGPFSRFQKLMLLPLPRLNFTQMVHVSLSDCPVCQSTLHSFSFFYKNPRRHFIGGVSVPCSGERSRTHPECPAPPPPRWDILEKIEVHLAHL